MEDLHKMTQGAVSSSLVDWFKYMLGVSYSLQAKYQQTKFHIRE